MTNSFCMIGYRLSNTSFDYIVVVTRDRWFRRQCIGYLGLSIFLEVGRSVKDTLRMNDLRLDQVKQQ